MARPVIEEIRCQSLINRVPPESRMPFRWTINPYRGCQHACRYCYARHTHEYLGLDTGLDFNTRIFVKANAPEVLRRELARRSWRRESVAVGTACDPYQSPEGRYRLTRSILELLAEYRTPATITTKSSLIVRDTDVLQELSRRAGCEVNFSVATLDEGVWQAIEPGTPPPLQRLRAMERLARAGVIAGVLMAPILPGLTDSPSQLDQLVQAAAAHGAQFLTPIVLHLRPGTRDWFFAGLEQDYPHLLARYRSLYPGSYAPAAYTRTVVEQVAALRRRHSLPDERPFRPLTAAPDQSPALAPVGAQLHFNLG